MSNDDFRSALDRREERWSAQLDRLFERVEGRLDKMEAKFDLRMDGSDKDVQREFGETRRDLGEMRDLIDKQGRRIDSMEDHRDAQVSASAEGAARGAGEAASRAAANTAKVTAAEVAKGFWRTWPGRIVALGTGIAALGAGIDNLPKVIVWVTEAIHYLSKGAAK
ncbi:hypothetical protein [Phenylobacterium sp.]|uniref:hypothetical protein n=1 Tax=Phenylobacterium sp. TaxID=1871053 RepID=UPI0027308C52|nr:hypothetical protein [Phenylobacterium sp.]MDP1599031.1 hypothetical protein [Phenylobacterium sp.]MDP3590459.1 hypothetical protein [Phenylobacterium sp.]